MGGYFDMNIPYNKSTTNYPNKPTSKTVRLKQAVKAIHLGYSGIAYNRTIKGVMSESHRCSTPLFPLSSVLKLNPSLSSAVRLHRNVLGVHPSGPFRQYTRVTVVVDSPPQMAALNSGNPVLKSYDIVAVRPTNQQTFEQACTSSEVDLISIDFEQLHFRLKQHIIKAAIERGIYFEIAYSALLLDAQLRRQMITSAKLLVDWTRGNNLIISSASPSVTEMRGPYDVANLSSLLGLSMENAKAALSKNCRSLLAKAMRKKHYYKDTIRVEIIPSGEEFDSNENWPKDWMKWDPISSGEGDLFLDDMAKSFCAANKVSSTVKPIDFASIIDKSPSHRLQVQKLIPVTDEPNKLATSFFDSFEGQNSLHINPLRNQSDSSKDFIKLNPSTHTECDMSNDDKTVSHFDDDLETHNDLDEFSSLETENLCLQSENCIRKCDTQVVDHIKKTDSSLMEIDISDAHEVISEVDLGSQDTNMKSVTTEVNIEVEQNLLPSTGELIYTANGNLKESTAVSGDITGTLPVEVLVDDEYENDHTAMKEVSIVTDKDLKGICSQTLCELKRENMEIKDVDVDVALPVLVSHDEINGSSQISVISEPVNEVVMEKQKENDVCAQSNSPVILSNCSSGKRKRKKKSKPGVPSQACVFPFKRLLNRTPFKRKSNKNKAQSKLP